jgi:hypothetical protein
LKSQVTNDGRKNKQNDVFLSNNKYSMG